MSDRVYSVAIVPRHPIQYMAGLWRLMAAHPRLDVHVIYLDTIGVDGTVDPTLNAPMEWDMPLLEGYSHEFVPNLSPARFTPVVDRINPKLAARLAARHFDAVVVHGYLSLSNWLLLRAAHRNASHVVYRGEGSVRSIPDALGRWSAALRGPIQSFYLRHCDSVACSSEDNRAYHLGRGAREDSLFLMPCAVDQDQLETFRASARSREAVRAAHGLPADATLAVSVTRFAANKRPLDTVEAFGREAVRQIADLHLVFVGDGPMRADLEARVRALGIDDRVHFVGFLNQSEMVELVLAGDLFVLPSERDPSPKALAEATYLGLPAVCSDSIGTGRDFVEEAESGSFFATGDVDAYAAAIARIVCDREQLERMGVRSHEIAARNDFRVGVANFVARLDDTLGPKA